MEKAPQNPNEVLTPLFVGEELFFIPVTEYYVCSKLKPAEALARIALKKAQEEALVEWVEPEDD